MLMSGRYNMMSGHYGHRFGEPCDGIAGIDLDPRYHITDRRIRIAAFASDCQLQQAL